MNEEEKKEAEKKAEAAEKDKADAIAAEKVRAEAEKIPAVEEAKKAAVDIKNENDRREKILEEEKKVLDRKESLNALGGGSPGGTEPKPNRTAEEEGSRKRIKSVADSSGAAWGKKYE